MAFKYMRIRPWTCPRERYTTLLKLQQQQYPEEVFGSTLWMYPPVSMWNHVKNIVYTELLRLRIWLHTPCERC